MGFTDPLVQGSNGNLYGTGNGGGNDLCGATLDGGIVEINLTGALLNNFSLNCTSQGGEPGAPLIQGNDGNFYGVTTLGGTFNFGTIFRLSPKGKITTLYNFQGPPNDGVGTTLGLV